MINNTNGWKLTLTDGNGNLFFKDYSEVLGTKIVQNQSPKPVKTYTIKTGYIVKEILATSFHVANGNLHIKLNEVELGVFSPGNWNSIIESSVIKGK